MSIKDLLRYFWRILNKKTKSGKISPDIKEGLNCSEDPRLNLKNLRRSLNLNRGSNMVGSI